MYKVNENTFTSFFKAISEAEKTRSNVIEVSTGAIRWTPAPMVSLSKAKRYAEQKAAFEAQERMKK